MSTLLSSRKNKSKLRRRRLHVIDSYQISWMKLTFFQFIFVVQFPCLELLFEPRLPKIVKNNSKQTKYKNYKLKSHIYCPHKSKIVSAPPKVTHLHFWSRVTIFCFLPSYISLGLLFTLGAEGELQLRPVLPPGKRKGRQIFGRGEAPGGLLVQRTRGVPGGKVHAQITPLLLHQTCLCYVFLSGECIITFWCKNVPVNVYWVCEKDLFSETSKPLRVFGAQNVFKTITKSE